jgi:hypothetical protein
MKLKPHLVVLWLVLFLAQATPVQSQERNREKPARGVPSYLQARPALGEMAPGFVLRDLEGKEASLKDWLGKRPIVIELGSYT